MDTALPQEFPLILDRNLSNCTGNRVCTSCDTVVLGLCLVDVEDRGWILVFQTFTHRAKSCVFLANFVFLNN